ncbi:hypothetical protein AX17_004520 [Amanita inopinata Kibby_2008]|nr:hypothetical protein AX17_004520 [Amanita inopinata Kibby_2008]
MLARWTRLPLRRCLHTRVPPAASKPYLNNLGIALGVSAATATYLTWRLTSDDYRIALDSASGSSASPSKRTTHKTTQPSLTVPESSAETPSTSHSHPIDGQTTSPAPETPQSTETEDSAKSEGDPDNSTSGGSGGAFNPETGEINWDCPCLGGMAHGPCGPEFREAFSCFVYSEADPKGIDCVEKFKAMQDCFRAHPDVYADEIMDDEDEEPAAPSSEEPSTSTDVENAKDSPSRTVPDTEPSSTDTPAPTSSS